MLVYIIYFIFFTILAVEYDLSPFKNSTLLVFVILLLGFLTGLRGPDVGKDYESYKIIFDDIYELNGISTGTFLPVLEPGFSLIVIVFRLLFHFNYVLPIMLFFGLVSVLLKVISINRLSANPYLVILFYFSHYFLLHEMTQIRIGLASAIFFIALIYYLKENKRACLLMIMLAILFHYSAIMYLVIFLFDSRRFNKATYTGILVVSLVLGYLKLPLLNFFGNFIPGNLPGRLDIYATVVENGVADTINVFNVLNLLNIAICVYFIIFIPKQQLLSNKPLLFFLKCNIISIFFLSFLSGVPSLAFRVSELFGLMSIFVYAYLINYLPFGKLNILITILIAGIVFYVTAFYGDLLRPYYFASFRQSH